MEKIGSERSMRIRLKQAVYLRAVKKKERREEQKY